MLDDRACDTVRIGLEEIYENEKITATCFSGLDAKELAFVNSAEHGGSGAHVYGDTDGDLVVHLIQEMLGRPISSDDSFCDLGSGDAKLVLQMLLLTTVKRGVGIELSPTRHTQAMAAVGSAIRRGLLTDGEERLQLFCASMLHHEAVARANLVYCYGLALAPSFLEALEADLLQRLPLGSFVLLRGQPFPSRSGDASGGIVDAGSVGADSGDVCEEREPAPSAREQPVQLTGRRPRQRSMRPVLETRIVNRVHQYFGYVVAESASRSVPEAAGPPAELELELQMMPLGRTRFQRAVFTAPEPDDVTCSQQLQELLGAGTLL